MEKEILKINAMTCNGCGNKVRKVVEGLGAQVSIDIPTRTVEVLYDEVLVTSKQIKDAIESVGYKVS
ncbi:heavy-metal-associated domain-containing protein [Bacillus cereus]|uniref:heavy-metal-associated domain-containing protein n=1 Tax=Bacillus cereus TaxID=1396 RepID=UPI000BED2184|nr:heavy-metal-associated domain-containing protein [Bacillus cereus]PEF61676.1 copper resistance protein CopZ [Bacillus cereus]